MPNAQEYQYTFRVNNSPARVRSEPSTDGNILGTVPPGATVYSNETTLGFDRLQWVKVTTGVTLENGAQLTTDGFIRQDLMTLVYSKAPTGYAPTGLPGTGPIGEYQRGYREGQRAAYQKMTSFIAAQQGV